MADEKKPAAPVSPAQPTYDPTEGMTTYEKFMAGVGKTFADTGRWAGNKVGLVSDEEIAEAKRLDAALMNTTAGKAGNLTGDAVLVAATIAPGMVAGAATTVVAGTVRAGVAVAGAAVRLAAPAAATAVIVAETGAGVGTVAGAGTVVAGTTVAGGTTVVGTTVAAAEATNIALHAASAGKGLIVRAGEKVVEVAEGAKDMVMKGVDKATELAKSAKDTVKLARTEPVEAAKQAAVAVKDTAVATAKVAAKATVVTAKVGVITAVPVAVISHTMEAAMAVGSDGTAPATVKESLDADGSTIRGGVAAATGATVLQIAGQKIAATELVAAAAKNLAGAAEGRLKLPIQVAGYIGNLFWKGATTGTKAVGVVVAVGEPAASVYVSTADSADPSKAVQVANEVREKYSEVKTAQTGRLHDGTVSGAVAAGGTDIAAQLIEMRIPIISNIVSKEDRMLHTADVDYNDPRVKSMADQRLLAISANPEDKGLQDIAIRRVLTDPAAIDNPQIRRIAEERLLAGDLDLTNPKLMALAERALDKDLNALQAKHDAKDVNDAQADLTVAAMQVRWKPLLEARATVAAAAEAANRTVVAQAPAEAAPAQAAHAQTVVHHPAKKPHESFNQQAAVSSTPSEIPSVSMGGLTPMTGALPPLVAGPAIESQGAPINTTQLQNAGTLAGPESAAAVEQAKPTTVVLNTRPSSPASNNPG